MEFDQENLRWMKRRLVGSSLGFMSYEKGFCILRMDMRIESALSQRGVEGRRRRNKTILPDSSPTLL